MTNPLCECPVAGYCTRHKLHKNETEHALCSGAKGQAGWKYFVAWEGGHMGATRPVDAVLDPPPFQGRDGMPGATGCGGCGGPVARPSVAQRVMSATAAAARFIGDGMQTTRPEEESDRSMICGECPLNENGTCNGCGCIIDLKVKARLEECPAKRWHADLHAARLLANPIRNLIMHILPVASNDNWKWNLDQIAARQNLFNGKRVLAIAVESRGPVQGKVLTTVSADEVVEYCNTIGLEWTQIEAFENNARLREVHTFRWLLDQVQSSNREEITFACHAKGTTHANTSIARTWAERQYHVCLDDWQTIWRTMERYSMAGAFRKFGEFTTPGNHRWHYSGTFYWFRHDDVFASGKD